MGSDPKTPTAPRVITGKLSSKRLPSLKLPAAFSEEKASTMSWDNVRHGSHQGGSPQDRLRDEQTCGTTLASAYVLHCLSAT